MIRVLFLKGRRGGSVEVGIRVGREFGKRDNWEVGTVV